MDSPYVRLRIATRNAGSPTVASGDGLRAAISTFYSLHPAPFAFRPRRSHGQPQRDTAPGHIRRPGTRPRARSSQEAP